MAGYDEDDMIEQSELNDMECADRIAEAVAAEREACAKIAEDHAIGFDARQDEYCAEIASAIRERNK